MPRMPQNNSGSTGTIVNTASTSDNIKLKVLEDRLKKELAPRDLENLLVAIDPDLLDGKQYLYIYDIKEPNALNRLKRVTLAQLEEYIGEIGPTGPIGPRGPQGPKGDKGDRGADGTSVTIKPTEAECVKVGDAYIDAAGDLQILTILKPRTFKNAGQIKGPKGDKGATGPQGPKGDKGDVGPKGAKGDKGDKGDAFTYEDFTPEQLAALKGPKGDKGDQGIQGEKGDQGIQGIQGEKGDKGDTGETGAKGDKGDKGDTGDTGPQGPQGIQGPQGDKGDTGDQGPAGPQGNKGDIGPTGKTGPTGATGADGKSAYELAVEAGYIGTEEQWLASLIGPTGATGANGLTPSISSDGHWWIGEVDTGYAAQGPAGADGATGATGPQGPQGVDGVSITGIIKTGTSGLIDTYTIYYSDSTSTTFTVVNGAVGPTGETGQIGPTGRVGPTGLTGPTGANGLLGPTGPTGATGAAGQDGAKGPTGSTGPTGPMGIAGPTGPQGEKGNTGRVGPTGATGAAGLTTAIKLGASGTTYTQVDGTITLPAYPADTSDLTNGAGFITSSYHDSTKQNASTLDTDVGVWGYTKNAVQTITLNGTTFGPTGANNNINLGSLVVPSDLASKQDVIDSSHKLDWSLIDNQPHIPDDQVQADWNQDDDEEPDFIKNKPLIPAAITESTVSNWGFTKNHGTITGITMNGASKGTSGVVDLGNVVTDKSDKQDVLTVSSLNQGIPITVIGFDVSDNLIYGDFSPNPVQDLTGNYSFEITTANWLTLKSNHYFALNNISYSTLDGSKEFINIKGTINSATRFVKLNKNTANLYAGIFFIEETEANVDHLYELAVYYSNLSHTMTFRCATIY